jgi:hypothetical protein
MGESPLDPQFVHYLEAGIPNWEPGFVLLTFADGHLLQPETVTRWDHADDTVQFRGELINV